MYLVSCIFIAIALSCHECTALDYLSPGFAHVKLNDGSTETFKVDDYYRVPVALEAFRLTNVPSQVPLQSTTFTLVRGKEINDHSVFFNGQYYIFFLQNVEPHGTWLLGDRLGVDSGVAYLRPDVHTVVPLDMESLTSQWHFLKNGKWVAEKGVRAEPTDVDIVRRISFNSIVYFSGVDDFSSQSVLLMTPVDRSQQNVRSVGGDGDLFRFSPALNIALPSDEFPAEKYPLYWSLETGQWAPFTLLYALPKAAPVRLIASKAMTEVVNDAVSGKTRASSQVVHLVGEEGSSRGWRLFLRVSDKDAGGELELKLTLSRSGLESNYKIKSLKKSVMSTFVKKQNKKVIDLKVGSYVWMWFHSEAETLGKSRYLAFAGDNFLLKCVGKTTTEGKEKYVFEYYQSHRRVAMDRSVLSMHTSLVSAMWNSDTNSLEWSLDGSPLIVDALFSLGPDPVTWLRDYLISHEDFLAPGLSSCFMYHGGLSMPQQLIYAAEMICVLIGSKPMTMVGTFALGLYFHVCVIFNKIFWLFDVRFSTHPRQTISGNFLLYPS